MNKKTLKENLTSQSGIKKLSEVLLMHYDVLFPEEARGYRIIVNGYQEFKHIELLSGGNKIDIDMLIERLTSNQLLKKFEEKEL